MFGASGAIGGHLCSWFEAHDYEVLAVSRSGRAPLGKKGGILPIEWDPLTEMEQVPELLEGHINAVVWAQGQNFNDNINSFELAAHEEMYRANVVYIMKTLQSLLKRKMLAEDSRLCLISSIWQNIARQNKLSYTVTKSALQGLVQSLAIDLGDKGILVNAVLPGVTDTPMTRANLGERQIQMIEQASPIGRLPTLDDIGSLVGFLCSSNNTGITGQFICADTGFSNARII